jgi:hypothetical protein
LEESLSAALEVIDVVEQLGVPYFLGGSLASTIYGIPRSTLDADIVADLKTEHAAALVGALGDTFYADLGAIQEAIRNRSSFNLIHLATAFKVDVFIPKDRTFDQLQFRRAVAQHIDPDSDRTAMVCAPEDIILAKLEWYCLGNEIADRQWRDVLGVLKTQGRGNLDLNYLETWADRLNLSRLLEQALEASGVRRDP